jgi:transcriptional regulator with XRE-family HTH domain
MEIPEQLIAKRIRDLRENRRLTLDQVATKAGMSKSFLSKVERCNVSISIAALSRLANAFDVSIGEFFDSEQPESEVIFVPRAESRTVSGTHGSLFYDYEVLIPRRGMRVMQPTLISINGRKARFELRQHPGEQFIYMMEGETDYVCGNREFTLRPGDCLYFNARVPHGPKVKRSQHARYIAVYTNSGPQAGLHSPRAKRS